MDLNDINRRIRELVEEGKGASAYAIVRSELLEHYSTDEGRAEIDATQYKTMRTAEAVDLLMQGVPSRIAREERKRG